MTSLRKTLFISDVHLEENRPDITHEFIKLLETCHTCVDGLYILGDLFEAWIGDDDDSPFHQVIINSLSSITQKGIPVYFLYGNRDFLIGKNFLQKTGCQLLNDETKVTLYGEPALLMHGDTLCTQDLAYLKARKFGRNHFLQFLFLQLPLKLRKNFANKMRAKSARYTQAAPREIMDVTQAEVARIMQQHEVFILIHGHTHRPAFHQFTMQLQMATRIVLGAWHDGPNMLVWDETGKKEWVKV